MRAGGCRQAADHHQVRNTVAATVSVMGCDENPPVQGTDSVQPVPLKRKLPTSLVAAAEDQAHAARLARLRSSPNASSSQPDCDESNSSTRGSPTVRGRSVRARGSRPVQPAGFRLQTGTSLRGTGSRGGR